MMTSSPTRHHFETVDSTISRAWELQASGLEPPFWVTADQQEAGRGRTQRHWDSPKGNAYTTLLTPLDPHLPRNLLPFAVSLAVRAAVLSLLPPTLHGVIELKWPNDVLASGAKLAGILIESRRAASVDLYAIGVGINVVSAPEGLDRPVSHLGTLGSETTAEDVFQALQEQMNRSLTLLAENADAIIPAWSRAAIGIGKAVTVRLETEILNGTFDHLAADGALMLRQSSGAVRAIYAGDLFVAEG